MLISNSLTDYKLTIISAEVNANYQFSAYQIQIGRDCLEGEDRIKYRTYDYLPHPSQVDTTSDEQQARYCEFLAGAEFDDYPSETKRSILGKMRLNDAEVEVPGQVDYLVNDFDGDGMTMQQAMEYAAGNALLTKWHLLVTDYDGLGDVDLTSVSIADKDKVNPRAKVKQYCRENVVNWNFARINGTMQLNFLMLLERGQEFDQENYSSTCIESYWILALDENGDYYQKKVVYGKSGKEEGERDYITVNGKALKWLPVAFACDEAMPPMELPKPMGFIYPVCLRTLSKYRVSAVYKEVQRNLSPTTFTSGWKDGDAKIFKDANNGRTYISTGAGAVNNLPDGVAVNVSSAAAEMSDFHWYFTETDKKIRQLGGTSKEQGGNMTATEADINANDQNAMLESLASSLEDAFTKCVMYALMFEGAVQSDDLESIQDDININLPRDFSTPRLSVDEVRVLIELRMARHISEQELMRQISNGGWLVEDVQNVMDEIESEMPDLNLDNAQVVQPVDKALQNNENSDNAQSVVEQTIT